MSAIEVLLDDVYAAVTVGVIVYDLNGRLVRWNESAARILGLSASEVESAKLEQPLTSTIREDGSLFPVEEYPSVVTLRTGQPQSGVIVGIHGLDGTLVWISIDSRPVSRDGVLQAVVVTFTDVSERKRVEESLRHSEERFSAFMSHLPASAFVKDRDGRLVFVNQYVRKIFGDQPWEGRGSRELSPGELGLKMEEHDRQVLQNGRCEGFDYVVDADGGRRIFHAIKFPIDLSPSQRLLGGIAIDVTDQKAAEAELRESELRFRSLYENTTIGLYRTTPDGRILLANPCLLHMLGYSSFEELARRNLCQSGFEPGYNRHDFMSRIEAEGEVRGLEASWTRHDGTVIFVRESARAIRDASGTILHYEGTVEDISERKRAEEELKLSQRRLQASIEHFQTIANCIPDTVFTTDLSGHFTYINPGVERSQGWTVEECLKLDVRQTVSPQQVEVSGRLTKQELRKALAPGYDRRRVLTFESEQLRKDGTTFWAEVNVSLLWSEEGKPVGFIGVARDITERKRSAVQLARVNQIVSMALRAGKAGAWELDLNTQELFWTPEYLVLLGVDPEFQPSVESFLTLVHPEDRALVQASLERSASEGAAFQHEFRMVLADGVHWMERRGVVLRDDTGKLARIVGITADITARKNAEAEHASLQAQLIQAQKMESLGRLAGGVAHDFNNLLTVINGYSRLLLKRLHPLDPLAESATAIAKAGESAAALTRQLLTISRRQVVQAGPVELSEFIRESLDMLGRVVGEDVEMVADLDRDAGWVLADADHLQQVVMNLVVNARDAMPEGGRLTLRTSPLQLAEGQPPLPLDAAPGRYVVLEVSDTGVGMSEEVQRHMFEPFYTTKGAAGTGLGLSTVYGIVHQGGGWIAVDSRPGVGTTFRVGWPLQGGTGVPPESELRSPASLEGSETILVVEDQDDVRQLAVTLLREFGYRTMAAASGAAAMELLERHAGAIDLVLTDVVMPGMSGRHLAERVRESYPEVQVLLMSGYPSQLNPSEASLQPQEDYISKPLVPELLAQKIRERLGRARPQRKILLLDDDSAVRQLLAVVLGEGGYEVTVAADDAEAHRLLQQGQFGLLITDLMLANTEGTRLMRIAREQCPRLKVLILSDTFGGEFFVVAKALGADVALQKPVPPDRLLETVRRVLA